MGNLSLRRALRVVRETVRRWLFGEEIETIARMYSIAKATSERVDAIPMMQARLYHLISEDTFSLLVQLQGSLLELRKAADQHYRDEDRHNQMVKDALAMLGEIHGSQERLLLLLEPKAQQLTRRRPAIQGWDQVQVENLQQELEQEEKRA